MKTEDSTAATEETLLGIYLNDHLAVLTVAADLARRAARGQQDTPAAGTLDRLAGELAEDRSALLAIMGGLDVPVRQYKVLAARAAERIGRLKPNGHLVRRSPLSNVVEIEALQVELEATAVCWRTLQDVAGREPRLDAGRLASLLDRTQRQIDALEQCRAQVVAEVFGGSAAAESAKPAPEAKAEPAPEAKAEHKPEPKAKAEPKPEPKAKAEPKPEPEPKAEAKPKTAAKAQPKAKVEPKPEPEEETAKDLAEKSGALGLEPADLPDAPSHDELPLPDYDHLPVGSLQSRIRPLDRVAVEQLLAYEKAHADRLQVVIVLQRRLAELVSGAEPTSGSTRGERPEQNGGSKGGSRVSPATAGPAMNPPSHGDPTNPAQPR